MPESKRDLGFSVFFNWQLDCESKELCLSHTHTHTNAEGIKAQVRVGLKESEEVTSRVAAA